MPSGFERPLKHLAQVFHLALGSLLDSESHIFSSPGDSFAELHKMFEKQMSNEKADYFLFERLPHIWIFNVFEAIVSCVL